MAFSLVGQLLFIINFHNELVKIKSILFKNLFPYSLIDTVIRNFINKKFSPKGKSPQKDDDQQVIVYCLPYLGNLSFGIRNNINKLIKSHYPEIQLA